MTTLSVLTTAQLKGICKEHDIRGFSNKKKEVLVAMVAANPAASCCAAAIAASAQRTKRNAGANEREDLSKIIAAIQGKTSAGLRLCAAFSEFEPGSEILDARLGGGGTRSAHYDLEFLIQRADIDEPTWKRIEHKGSSVCAPFVDGEVPWAAGVQFHNGRARQYDAVLKFARIWYDAWIGSGRLTETWDLGSLVTPTFDEWFVGACCVDGESRIPWVIELKKRVKASREGNSLLAERVPVVARFVAEFTTGTNSRQERDIFMRQVFEVASSALKQKDYWLCIRGYVDGEFHVCWFPPIVLAPIVRVDVSVGLDVKFKFICADGLHFKGLLRFGYGAGFSNLRIDLK